MIISERLLEFLPSKDITDEQAGKAVRFIIRPKGKPPAKLGGLAFELLVKENITINEAAICKREKEAARYRAWREARAKEAEEARKG